MARAKKALITKTEGNSALASMNLTLWMKFKRWRARTDYYRKSKHIVTLSGEHSTPVLHSALLCRVQGCHPSNYNYTLHCVRQNSAFFPSWRLQTVFLTHRPHIHIEWKEYKLQFIVASLKSLFLGTCLRFFWLYFRQSECKKMLYGYKETMLI